MPQNALRTLTYLIGILHLPSTLNPTTLQQIPPSLLHLILSRIQRSKLPNLDSELETIKLVLGVLAIELPDIALGLVEPLDVVRGERESLEVVVLALAVLARRRGLWEGVTRRERVEVVVEAEEEFGKLQEPIEPDVSFVVETLPSQERKEKTLLQEMVDTLGLDPRTIVTKHTAPERHARDLEHERARIRSRLS